MPPILKWAIKWRSDNALDGKRERLGCGHTGLPIIFRTRAEAQTFIRQTYGYIAKRPDLRREPHGWKMPKAVRVRIIVEEAI